MTEEEKRKTHLSTCLHAVDEYRATHFNAWFMRFFSESDYQEFGHNVSRFLEKRDKQTMACINHAFYTFFKKPTEALSAGLSVSGTNSTPITTEAPISTINTHIHL